MAYQKTFTSGGNPLGKIIHKSDENTLISPIQACAHILSRHRSIPCARRWSLKRHSVSETQECVLVTVRERDARPRPENERRRTSIATVSKLGRRPGKCTERGTHISGSPVLTHRDSAYQTRPVVVLICQCQFSTCQRSR